MSDKFNRPLRFIYYTFFIRAIVQFILGLNVRHREKLPREGPAIIVANHNSHLDTMVLMTLIPSRLLPITRPVAAMDYFLSNKILAWFALRVVGILPIKRVIEDRKENPLQPLYDALSAGEILIFFPEGSRGEPEKLSEFKSGIAKISSKFPEIPVIPVSLHGLGKALPKGEALLVPFFCDVFVGDALKWSGNRKQFMQDLEERMKQLADEGRFPTWE